MYTSGIPPTFDVCNVYVVVSCVCLALYVLIVNIYS